MQAWNVIELRGLILHIAVSERGLSRLSFGPLAAQGARGRGSESETDPANPLIRQVSDQLAEYFDGERKEFALPLDLGGTPFQMRVWEALQTIPFGKTITYAELARRAGSPGAFRAAGAANGKNPVAIIVPCHRVINTGGGLGGYGGGIDVKRRLLALEASLAQQGLPFVHGQIDL